MTKLVSVLSEFFSQPSNLVGPAIVAAVVSALVNSWLRRKETTHRLEAEYEYEQKKKLRDVIARFHGRLLSYGNSLNHRMWNLYQNHSENWLSIEGKPTRENYYYLSFAYRFLNFCSLLREFEGAAIVVDSRVGSKVDLEISNLVAALRWCLTDVALFEGLPYAPAKDRDHFFSDRLRQVCDDHLVEGGRIPTFDVFCQIAEKDGEPALILKYFDGLTKGEDRLRWDRLVAFHLLLLGLINVIGNPVHVTSQEKITRVASEMGHLEILENLLAWLPRLDAPSALCKQIRVAKRQITTALE